MVTAADTISFDYRINQKNITFDDAFFFSDRRAERILTYYYDKLNTVFFHDKLHLPTYGVFRTCIT